MSAPPAPRGWPSAWWWCKHALRNALIPVITLGALEFGQLLAGAVLTEHLHHPRLRQADRRCRVQPRLPGGAGRRAGHRAAFISLNLLADLLYMPSIRGCGGMSMAVSRASGPRGAPPCRRRALRALPASRAALFGGAGDRAVRRCCRRRAAARARRSACRRLLDAIRKAPSRGALVRHRRARPRRAVAGDLRRAGLAAGRRRLGADRAGDRHADRAARRLFRRLDATS